MADTRQIKVRSNERVDQIAARVFDGDPYLYTKIIEQNPHLDIFYPMPQLLLQVDDD